MKSYSEEEERLAALQSYDILDTTQEETFDRITRLTKAVLEVPIVAVSLVDAERQWFKSRHGMEMTQTARSVSFCAHTIQNDVPFIVEDAASDWRFRDSPLVKLPPHVRYYAGVPLRMRGGYNIGALCVMDTQVRQLTGEQIRILQDFSRLVVDEIELRKIASTDSLTGSLSRRSFLEAASRDIARSKRAGVAMSCAVIDIDRFKAINDAHGHAIGDRVLHRAMSACRSHLRASDYVGRLGGEEFAVVFPDTSLATASQIAERLRVAISAVDLTANGERIRVTASIGLAERMAASETVDELLGRADSAMYSAKAGGRNQIVCNTSPSHVRSAATR